MISSSQIILLLAFLVALVALTIYLRRKPQMTSFFNKVSVTNDVQVSSKMIGPGVTWYKVQDDGKTWVFVNNGQQLLKLDEYQSKKDETHD